MKPINPIGDYEARKRYAMKLCRWANTWFNHIAPLHARWEVNERLVINQPDIPSSAELPWDGAKWYHIPVSSSKGDAWKSFVCQPPMSSTPYGVSTIFGRNATRAKDVEQDLYQFMLRGEFSRYYCRNTWAVGLYGKSIWRVTLGYDEDEFPRFEYEDIAPRSWFIYPNVTDMSKARMMGHRYELSVSDAELAQDRGEFYEDAEIKGKGQTYLPNRPPVGIVPNETTTGQGGGEDEPEDDELQLTCAEAFVKEQWGDDKKPKWYLVRFDLVNQELLGVYDYPYSVPWYFEEFVHEEPERHWPETSRINNIQALQHATNALFNQGLWGIQMAWDPATFTPGWALDKKYTKLKPGTMVPIAPGGGAISQTSSTVNMGAIETMMDNTDKRADRSMRFSDLQLGAPARSGDRTATGDSIQQQNASIASTDDMASISNCIGKILRFQQELYRKHYPEFHDKYQEDLAVQPDSTTYAMGYPKILARPMMWELLGKTPDNAPIGQTHAITTLIQSLAVITNPVAIIGLDALGFDVAELIQSLVKQSNLNDRDIILVDMDLGKEKVQAYIQEVKQQQAQAAASKHAPPDPAKAQMEAQKLQLDAKKMEADSQQKHLAELVKIFGDADPEIKRQIEQALGLQPSRIHPVVAQALKDGAIHQSILTPQETAPTNGKAKASVIR